MPFSVLVASNVFVACLFLDEGSLAVPLVFKPVPVVGISGWILHETLAVAEAEDEITRVDGSRVGDMFSVAVIVALFKGAAVVFTAESGIDSLGAGEGLGRVLAGLGGKILNQAVGAGD